MARAGVIAGARRGEMLMKSDATKCPVCGARGEEPCRTAGYGNRSKDCPRMEGGIGFKDDD